LGRYIFLLLKLKSSLGFFLIIILSLLSLKNSVRDLFSGIRRKVAHLCINKRKERGENPNTAHTPLETPLKHGGNTTHTAVLSQQLID
jgi:hypothetical protein